jgi:peptidoglycan/xylan/chitin deacetylase (PgdA/CDA1 family)
MTRFASGFIVAFHDIAPEKAAALVEALDPARPLPLGELLDRASAGKSTAGRFAITVDDGVGDTVRGLSRLFLARRWPATFFLPTYYVDSGEAMAFQWWRRIHPLLPARRFEVGSTVFDLSRAGAIERLARSMERRWHAATLESYRPLTMALVEFVLRDSGLSREALRPAAPITWPEVAQLARTGFIEFQSHGVTHAAMSSLTDDQLAFELRHSRDTITEHCGRACRFLAYPFGSWTSIGPRAAAAATRYYDAALTMTLGHIGGAAPALVPRIPLYPENSKRMARWKVALKCTSLGTSGTSSSASSPSEAPTTAAASPRR